ncbi:hypothetical protein [Endozoicomonas ascidiicola]|uniref:hypothetical protein n=1 Tax=Endozoicomonas ascidiicola TaxID=1698521 RepID=UPI00082CF766|nr:hypothetical protein [Endozoicomonas ascidiicola]
MDLALLDTLIRIAVPFLVGWNVFLFNQSQRNKDALHTFQLHVAESYTSKADLQKMLTSLEERLEKQLSNFFKTIHRGE